MPSGADGYDTIDGHNAEIYYTYFESDGESREYQSFNDLENSFRAKGYSVEQLKLNRKGEKQRGKKQRGPAKWSLSRSVPPPTAPIPPAAPSPPQVGASNVDSDDDISSRDGEDDGVEDESSSLLFGSIPPPAPSPPPALSPLQDVSSPPFMTTSAPAPNPPQDEEIKHREPKNEILVLFGYSKTRELEERLRSKQCTDLISDAKDFINADHIHGACPVPIAASVVRHMRTPTGESHWFNPENDTRRRELKLDMPESCFEAILPQPVEPGKEEPQVVFLPHVTFPGWSGGGAVEVDEWVNGIELAHGRLFRRSTYDPETEPEHQHSTLEEAVRTLGYPDVATFAVFIHRADIKAAFRELWDASLRHISTAAWELPHDDYRRMPVGSRILRSRSLRGACEYDEAQPDKKKWTRSCHLARFCLQVEKICYKDLLPPIQGQIPLLLEKAPAGIVAWGGIELARTLWRLETGVLDLAVADMSPQNRYVWAENTKFPQRVLCGF